MKIKRRTKNDRTAFWYMNFVEYFKYRRSINLERRLDRTLPPATRIARDRNRAAFLAKEFKQGPGVSLAQLLPYACPVPLDKIGHIPDTL